MAKRRNDADDDFNHLSAEDRLAELEARMELFQGRILASELIARWYLIGHALHADDPIAKLHEMKAAMISVFPAFGSGQAIRDYAIQSLDLQIKGTEQRLRGAMAACGRLPADELHMKEAK